MNCERLLLLRTGVDRSKNTVKVDLPQPHLKTLRQGKGSSANRLVMDLSGPALVQRQGDDLLLQIKITPLQESHLRRIGLQTRRGQDGLKLLGQSSKLSTLTLKEPWRVVLDGITPTNPSTSRLQYQAFQRALLAPEMQGPIMKGLVLDQRVVQVGVKPIRLYRAGVQHNSSALLLRPLAPQPCPTRIALPQSVGATCQSACGGEWRFFQQSSPTSSWSCSS